MHGLHSSHGVFLLAALVLAFTPGPGLAYVVARTAAGGWRAGIASSLGTAVGGLGHVVAAALGLSVLLAQSAIAFSTIRYIGAAYLIYLGLSALLSRTGSDRARVLPQVASIRAFRDGVLVELLNVKTALFFLSFIPQFVEPGSSPAGQFVLLGMICVALNTSADLLAVAGASRFLKRPAGARHAKALRIGSGVTLLSLGAYVALSRHEG